jgi:hypothetical protein
MFFAFIALMGACVVTGYMRNNFKKVIAPIDH